jgi:diguanylate cyclase (GGDEF)-like protein/PAS domain S-box-containing protein
MEQKEKERILVVEDERIIAIDLQRRLEKLGYLVVGLCTTGSEAIDTALKESPDLILMDIMLERENAGIEAAKVIKDRAGIPVIFLTAYADEQTLDRAKEAEPFGYILKPFKERELHTSIDIALYKHRVDKTLKRQERRFSAILHSIGDGIVASDNRQAIQFMNPVAEELTGWTEEDAIGRPLNEVLSLWEEKTDEPIRLGDITTADPVKSGYLFKESYILQKGGDSIPVEGTVACIRDKDDRVEGQVVAIRDVSEVREMTYKLSYQASHDALTGLYNRYAFSRSLDTLIQSARSEHREHSLIYVDLDQFKLINDTIGHGAGDELLLETTGIIRSVFRSSDICARLGGDEFGILLGDTPLERAHMIAQRLHNRLSEKRLQWGMTKFNINSSIGLVMINAESGDIHSVLAAADDACYIAKDEGGRRIKIYETTDTTFKKRRGEMQWVTRLTGALEENRFELYYQSIVPIQEADGEENEKIEILLRMLDENGEVVPPKDFLPAAERYNLMPLVDRWVVRTAMQKMVELNTVQGIRRQFSINLSADTIAEENFFEFIQEQFAEFGVSPEDFCFEITETIAISNMNTAGRFIKELKRIGCVFALDDFGSGFSSFNYLKNMPVDMLKIDGSFVMDMDVNPVNSAMVEAINNLGHVMKIKTIAEFVKNTQILEELKKLGVDYAQGYEIGRPAPLEGLLTSAVGNQ